LRERGEWWRGKSVVNFGVEVMIAMDGWMGADGNGVVEVEESDAVAKEVLINYSSSHLLPTVC